MMKNLFRPFLRNSRGSLLILGLLIVIIFVALAAAFVLATVNDSRFAERQRRLYQAFQIAEAGMNLALFDLRQDFLNDPSSPSWADGDINGFTIGPDTSSYYTVPYTSTTLNGGSFTVELLNIAGLNEAVWVKSTATLGDITQTIRVYARIKNISPWNNAIFAGAGASGAMVNGNVDIRGSVHILGTGLSSTDFAIDLGGTAELVGNNYDGLSSALAAKVPALPTVLFNGETVETLNSELRVKRGQIGLSGDATAGEADVAGNALKETIDGSYVTDGFGGTKAEASVYSDNGWSNQYDLGDAVSFPSLSDAYGGYSSYQEYLKANALVIDDPADLSTISSITPGSSFSFSDANGSIAMDGAGNLTVSGIVYVDGGSVSMAKSGSDDTIEYTGTGSMLVTGNVQIDINLVTAGNNSFPNNVLAVMTPANIGFDGANIDVMGLFYGESQITVAKQTDILGTIVSNYFDMGTNVPAIFQVPETINSLPAGLIGQSSAWRMDIVSWEKI